MNNYLKIFSAIICGIALFSCEREIDLEIEGAGDTVVVEGSIYEGELPILTLTRTFSFYDKLSFEDVNNLFIQDADIKMWVNNDTIQLEQISFQLGEDSSTVVTVYTPNFFNPNVVNFLGKKGNTYHLGGTVGNKSFTASTHIPHQSPIDSIWYESHPKPSDYPQLVRVYVQTSDPDTLGNRYRIYTQRNQEDFYTESNSIFDDSVINGTYYQVPATRAPAPFDDSDDINTYGYFNRGDTIVIRRCGIDEGVYDFLASMEYISSGSGGPFGSATVLKSNIKGEGVIGVWAGFSIEDAFITVEE